MTMDSNIERAHIFLADIADNHGDFQPTDHDIERLADIFEDIDLTSYGKGMSEAIHHYTCKAPEGHGLPCHICGEKINGMTGNAAKWPVGIAYRSEPGKMKWHHMGCVSIRLEKLSELEAALP